MKSTSPMLPSGLTNGAPLELTTSAQTIHVGNRISDMIISMVNATGTDRTVTLSIAGTALVLTVPANSAVAFGPFSFNGTVTALADAGSAVKVVASVRVADII